MSARLKAWLVGSPLAAALAIGLARDDSSRELAALAFLLALATVALVAEGIAWRGAVASRANRPTPEGARPADGVVDVVPIVGVESRPNPIDRRWRCFDGVDAAGSPAAGPARLPAGDPPLLGRVVLVSTFVGMDGRGWTVREIGRAHESLIRAGLWIEGEAGRRQAPVNIGLAETYFRFEDGAASAVKLAFVPEGDDVGPMEEDATTKYVALASRAAAGFGFSDVVDWLARINPRIDADARVWLFHLRQAGRSLAIPASESGLPGVGLAIGFAREASFPEPLSGEGRVDPTTIVHELLHLFGASDKYGVPLPSYPPRSVSGRDIMRLDHVSLSRMRVDDLTAAEVGWRDVGG